MNERRFLQAMDLEILLWRKSNDRFYIPYEVQIDMKERAKKATKESIESLRKKIRAIEEQA